jgi:ATP-dependent Lon protease
MRLPLDEKQNLLATLDPVARLTRVDALMMNLSVLPPSPALEATRRRALDHANERKYQYATLEHLLLALIDVPMLPPCLSSARPILAHYKLLCSIISITS